MNAAEATALTEAANMRAVFEASCQAVYNEIMNQVTERASQGIGHCSCLCIECDRDGPLGIARERVIVERLKREGYNIRQNQQGTASYVLTWCLDRAPWNPNKQTADAIVALGKPQPLEAHSRRLYGIDVSYSHCTNCFRLLGTRTRH